MRFESLDAYRDVLPTLSNARKKVLAYIVENGPCTGRQINQGLGSQSAHKRLSELERLGVIRCAGVIKCPITGQSSNNWECSPRECMNPKAELARPQTKNQMLADIFRLESEKSQLLQKIARLESIIGRAGIPIDQSGVALTVPNEETQLPMLWQGGSS